MPSHKHFYDPQRVAFLAQEVMRHKRLYYAGRPKIEDRDFDRLEAELRALAPDHPALRFVGTDLISESRKVQHDRPMLSLEKTYVLKDLNEWIDGHAVVGMWKIDGNSLSLIYRRGKLTLAKTRGDGRVGEDVTDKIRWVGDVVPVLGGPGEELPEVVEIRGELFCQNEAFLWLSGEMVERGLERPTNPRNIVAGMLGRKTNFDLARNFSFVAFDVELVGQPAVFKREWSKMTWLQAQGFKLAGAELLKSREACEPYLESVKGVMDLGEVGVDGVVFVYDDVSLQHEIGETSHHPRYKLSYKWQGETAHSVITGMTWATSRLGNVTPVAVIEPVFLSGATLTNVTLHNAAMVRANNLKTGDRIEVVRSGEVIPKFLAVVEAHPGTYHWPESCPSCGGVLEFDEVRLRCPNEKGCPAQQARGILNWIQNAEIEDLSEKRLEQLLELGLVQEIPDLYRLTKDDFLKLPQTKEKMATKLFKNIEKSRQLPISKFLSGLGIEGAGRTTWDKLLEVFHGLDGLLAATESDIAAVEGFAEKSGQQIVSGLKAKSALIAKLLNAGVQPQRSAARGGAALSLKGKQIVITGALTRPRSEVEDAIRAAGGSPGSAVSKNTYAIVTDDPASESSKMKKGRELGIPVWNERKLWEFIGALSSEQDP